MPARFAKFFGLPPSDRWLLMRAAVVLVTAKLALRTMKFSTACRMISGIQRPLRGPIIRPPEERIVWAVETAARRMHLTNCLVKALAAEAILTRAGYRCELKIGVAKDEPGALLAHAWLESDGRVLIGNFELDRYHPLASPRHPG